MKKILIFALLLVFAAFPAFSQTVGGELEYYMVNGSGVGNFTSDLGKAEINFNVDLGDYNSVSTEIEAKGGDSTGVKPDVRMNYAVVATDWAMMFGLKGFFLATTVGFDSFGTFDNVDFTGLNYENADNYGNMETGERGGFKLDLGFVDGLIQPYFAMSFMDKFDTWLVGSGFDFAGLLNVPLWLEVYYGDITGNYQLGIEAAYNLATEGGMAFDIGGFFQLDEVNDVRYGAGVGFGIAGVGMGVSFMGTSDEPFSVLGVDAEYFFLEWLGVNAAASFSFEGDGVDVFQALEAGVVANANEDIAYKIGYMYSAAAGAMSGNARSLNTDDNFTNGSGIYFSAIVDF